MRKILMLLCCCALWIPAVAGKTASVLPDNIYFRAMQDEMHRSLTELHTKGAPRLYYVAYKLIKDTLINWKASSGELLSVSSIPTTQITVLPVLGIGSDKNDQLGFEKRGYSYAPYGLTNVPNSYEGMRRTLWQVTDEVYREAVDSYVKKQSYKRQKSVADHLPDVTPAPQGTVFEELPAFPSPNAEKWKTVLKKLSAKGKGIAWLENFTVTFSLTQQDILYLNSLGGAHQIPFIRATVTWYAKLRNQEGYVQSFSRVANLSEYQKPDESLLTQQTDRFLEEMTQRYRAHKLQKPYLGPVLLRPDAAGRFVLEKFVWNVEYVKPLLSELYENDPRAAAFRSKTGLRVVSDVVDIVDDPLARSYAGNPLYYIPVDDEGVPAQKLLLTSQGHLQELPLSRRPVSAGHQSNGHARLTASTFPREMLTNVFVNAKHPLSSEELDRKFLDLCREWELEYCYEIERFDDYNLSQSPWAWRVYTKDGHKEPVFGLEIQSLSERSLRDIVAAGGETEVTYFELRYSRGRTVLTPSLLLQEVEMIPSDAKPDKPPFVTKPN